MSRSKKFQWRPGYYLILVGMVFLLYVFMFSKHGFIRFYRLHLRKKQLVKTIDELKKEQESLNKEIDMLTSNLSYIEKVAREQYQMGKKNEKIFLMVPSKPRR